jgi:hypothetical protein
MSEAIEAIFEYADAYTDSGPIDEGWKSPEVIRNIKLARAEIAALKSDGDRLKALLKRARVFVSHAQYWATGTRAQRLREKHDAEALVFEIDDALGGAVFTSGVLRTNPDPKDWGTGQIVGEFTSRLGNKFVVVDFDPPAFVILAAEQMHRSFRHEPERKR